MNLLAAEFFDVRRDNRGNPQAVQCLVTEGAGKSGKQTCCAKSQNQNQGKNVCRGVVVPPLS